jgi:hypothetical protein
MLAVAVLSFGKDLQVPIGLDPVGIHRAADCKPKDVRWKRNVDECCSGERNRRKGWRRFREKQALSPALRCSGSLFDGVSEGLSVPIR